ncbi:MAG: transglycosylase SLT domain-containing protein [Deltaproteobacteria bacterium]|nr:transglycosylase SLT domain-containing protein [Deltaproteobacteria bacterium]
MHSRLQPIWFGVFLSLSLYFLVWGIPSQLQKPKTAAIEPELTEFNSALVPGAIRLKASGEDPFSQGEETQAYLAAREKFEERFGQSFEEAWKSRQAIHHPFEIPIGIADRVQFWIKVFTAYSKYQYLFHHRDEVGVVYSTIDLSRFDPEATGLDPNLAARYRNQSFVEEKRRIQEGLNTLERKISNGDILSPEEMRLSALLAQKGISITDAASDENIRIQGGFSDQFKRALIRSGQYMAEMENIFTLAGLPVELTRLPLIESAFTFEAVSTAKAVGLWQFIEETGKNYLKIDDIADERRDPILATYAAANHLKKEYELLGSWPLAINAYNTGPHRMIKAVKQLGTNDIATIIKKFKEPGYQFYSRNYFPEFLAAVHVYDREKFYFGELEKMPAVKYDIFIPEEPTDVRQLCLGVNVSEEALADLNPGLSEEVLEGEKLLPPGYIVRVPEELGPAFALEAINQGRMVAENGLHVVREGDSLESVASLYHVPVDRLREANRFLPGQPLNAGMVLNLPRETGVALQPAAAFPIAP